MIEIKVPELAESITEGTISQWLINVGDKVEKGGSVVELETDKVNVEIIAEDSGIVSKLLGEPGDTVEVGATIAILDANGAPVAVSTPAPPAEQAKQETAEAPKAAAQMLNKLRVYKAYQIRTVLSHHQLLEKWLVN